MPSNLIKKLLPLAITATSAQSAHALPALEEVIITASKRAETLQDVSMSVSALAAPN